MTKLHPVVRHRVLVLFIMGILAGGIADAAGQTPFWPQFGGPNRDNISTEGDLLSSWPDAGPALIWTAHGLGHGFSSLSIVDGRIFSAGNIGEDTVVTALDLEGEILWQTKNGAAWTSSWPGTRGTPTVDGDYVYHESPHGEISCFDAKTGETKWSLNVLKKYNTENIRWALAESLLIDGDHVICSPGGPEVSMVALDKRTGEVVWTTPSTDDLSGYSSATLFEHEGLRIITTLTSKAIIGVNADNGKLLWRVEHESYTDQNTCMPIFHDGHLFITTIQAGSAKWKVHVNGEEASLEEIWRNENFDNQHGGVVMTKGNIYGSSVSKNRNKWICLDWETGEIEHMGTDVQRGSITYADGRLYMLGAKGQMGLVRPTESGSELVSSFEIPEGGKGASWAHPVVAGGRLYIRHGDFLYAYDVSDSN